MKIIETALPGVVILEPKVFIDERGFFMETSRAEALRAAGIPEHFPQDNHSRSRRGVIRGLHYQEPNPQGKLVRCTRGRVFDVAVDIRVGSPTFGQWDGVELTDENHHILWIPPGFAHGFCAMSDVADVIYKCTSVWEAPFDRGIAWNDPEIAIAWPLADPIVSEKDAKLPRLREAAVLPAFNAEPQHA